MSASQARSIAPGPSRAGFRRGPIDPAAFRAPLDFLAAEHTRQLAICDVLDRLVHNPRSGADHAELEAVRDYLVRDLPMHIDDEGWDLFPMLQRRCPVTDDVGEMLELLHKEHEADRELQRELVLNLESLIGGRAFDDPARFFMNAFAFSETQRRHLAWENTVILTRARRHLTEEDCAELGRRMAARRGIRLPA